MFQLIGPKNTINSTFSHMKMLDLAGIQVFIAHSGWLLIVNTWLLWITPNIIDFWEYWQYFGFWPNTC